MRSDVDEARASGLEVVPCLTHVRVEHQDGDARDATSDRIARHARRIGGAHDRDADVAPVTIAGLVGARGERRASTAGDLGTCDRIGDVARDVHAALRETVPDDRFPAPRTATDLRDLGGPRP